MAQGKNHVTLLGHVGKDVETRATPGGTVVSIVSLATTEVFKDKQGKRTNKTEWHNLVAFGRMAEVLRDHVRKGSRIDVVGRLQTLTWDDKESGTKRNRTEIVVRELILLDAKRKEDGNNEDEEYGDVQITDEDIPF
jgi:single-strand DNA-binding protein